MPVGEPLTIAAAQPPCAPYDVAANAATHAEAVRAADARVVALPKLSLTGYELDAPEVAVDDPRLTPIVEACGESGSLALAGAAVHGDAGGPHIATLAIDGAGVSVAYRKMWLGGAEAERFVRGNEPAVLEVEGWRLGLAVCKDAGVPRHASDTAAFGIDAYVAGVLERADDAAVPGDRARRVATDRRVWSWWRASPARPVAASTKPPVVPASGRPTASRSPRQGPEPVAIARATLN
jgi:predicted amidohydrolase